MNKLMLHRRLIITATQAFLMAITYWLSFALRFDFEIGQRDRAILWATLPLIVAIKLLYFFAFRLMQGWWCYVGLADVLDIAKAAALSFATNVLILKFLWHIPGYSRGVLAIDLLLTFVIMGGTRFVVRAYSESVARYSAQKKTLIVGAGYSGGALVKQLQRNPQLDLDPVGFIDDDASKRGIHIEGIKVLGSTSELPELVERTGARCVVIAIPSASGAQVRHIVDRCRASNVAFKILPAIDQQLNGASLPPIRDVRPEDLLGRRPVRIDMDAIRAQLSGKVVLVTGAGGSIGSQLVREVAAFDPASVILFERAENDLFKLCMECTTQFPRLKYVPVIGDILDVALLRDVFAAHRPDAVFHAAAYKHVPMMEQNCFQAVTNNVFGTYNVALVASQFRVAKFVMISSDKAVRPTNIMGVTKRVAELVVLALHDHHTRFSVVRFGNVLGSNGSVLPIFQQQIAAGGPITVTHPEAKRFFMTIPEAAQLVLQAGTMGQNSEIFVLDMGEQIRIVDLANNLVRLSGAGARNDIEIVYTGLRPGEKLYEELALADEQLRPTSHEKIGVISGEHPPLKPVLKALDELTAAVEAKNVSHLITTLQTIVHEYTPSEEMLTLSRLDRCDRVIDYRRAHAKLRSDAAGAA
jgi:FlaA1/EpsC-like NDP-sugar epimerase